MFTKMHEGGAKRKASKATKARKTRGGELANFDFANNDVGAGSCQTVAAPVAAAPAAPVAPASTASPLLTTGGAKRKASKATKARKTRGGEQANFDFANNEVGAGSSPTAEVSPFAPASTASPLLTTGGAKRKASKATKAKKTRGGEQANFDFANNEVGAGSSPTAEVSPFAPASTASPLLTTGGAKRKASKATKAKKTRGGEQANFDFANNDVGAGSCQTVAAAPVAPVTTGGAKRKASKGRRVRGGALALDELFRELASKGGELTGGAKAQGKAKTSKKGGNYDDQVNMLANSFFNMQREL